MPGRSEEAVLAPLLCCSDHSGVCHGWAGRQRVGVGEDRPPSPAVTAVPQQRPQTPVCSRFGDRIEPTGTMRADSSNSCVSGRRTQNCFDSRCHSSRSFSAILDPVRRWCSRIMSRNRSISTSPSRRSAGAPSDIRLLAECVGSYRKSSPPVIPAPMFRPVRPSTATEPPVMYSAR